MLTTRLEFLYGLGAMSVAPLIGVDRSEPDLILYNGRFWTVDARQPRAQAVAISNGR